MQQEANQARPAMRSEKQILPAALLCWFLFWVGGHYWYVGRPGMAVLHMLTLGGVGIWAIVDFFRIVTGNFPDSNGRKLTSWTAESAGPQMNSVAPSPAAPRVRRVSEARSKKLSPVVVVFQVFVVLVLVFVILNLI